MVNLHALIVDDHPAVREALEERVQSMGHTFDSVGCQEQAIEKLKQRGFDYVLLDLELPTRFGRTPMIPTGKNLLMQIRQMSLHKRTPVIVVTAHGHDGPDLAVDVMKLGADDFVKKPFDDLERRIMSAVARILPSANRASTLDVESKALAPFETGTLIVSNDSVEICGVRVCDHESGRVWQILNLLSTRTPKGSLPSLAGRVIADRLGIDRGEKGVAEAIKHFRTRAALLLAQNAGFACEGNDLVATTPRGYQLSPKLQVSRDAADASDTPPTPERESREERHVWVIEQVQSGVQLTRRQHEQHFGISTATAKRDFAALGDRVKFLGVGEDGYYILEGDSAGGAIG